MCMFVFVCFVCCVSRKSMLFEEDANYARKKRNLQRERERERELHN